MAEMQSTMIPLLGHVVSAQVTDRNDKEVFAQVEGQTLGILRSEFDPVPELGAAVQVLVYSDKHDHLRGTTQLPKVRQDHYAFATVTQRMHSLGVFVDIGLPDKDIVVSKDVLPFDDAVWPQIGDRLLVALSVDKKGRLWGELATPEIFQAIAAPAKSGQRNAQVKGTVYKVREIGAHVLTDDYQEGFIHRSEWFATPRLGQQVTARVIGTTQDHGLNLSLKPMAYEEISDDAQMILAMLEVAPDGTMPFSDKSTPEEIQDTFAISKGAFKRALGNLLKNRRITQADGHITLVPPDGK
ncbi:CvfB family protein [Schleiferilactobacillus shenzhenensis]|uniref:S1 motif domain-containing protein n=1 Tax=Schleiferilactobacillus shenzhenensis LY-73 TaxID=1231336 RepID=U4TZ14_9LACO|nr:S1-like domain-containing RNA-binding protein [Schleiferilactobacillus shenzhenensis]ERL66557.1 hypothetical protein L248_0236 [Schleiferilactobacillus shenzhenensis LY-73]